MSFIPLWMKEYLNYCFWVFWHISPKGVQGECFCEQNRFDVANSAQIVHFSRLHNFSSNSYFNLILEPLWTFVHIFYTWVLYGFLLVLLYCTVDASLHGTGYIHCLVWGNCEIPRWVYLEFQKAPLQLIYYSGYASSECPHNSTYIYRMTKCCS